MRKILQRRFRLSRIRIAVQALFTASIFLAISGVGAETNPFPFSLGTVSGFTDLHAHQMGHLGFGGRHYWGSHEGPESTALKGCSGTNHALSWLPIATSLIHQPDLGMHTGGKHGYHSDPDKRYRDWPVWQSTVHQQYWEGHLKQAHQDGLRLFMMSAVNFDYLCEIEPVGNTNSFVLADLLNNPQDVSKQCDDMVNVKRQLRAAHDFAAKNSSWYQIAETAAEARSIIQQGKMAVVLQVEASKIWGPKNDADWDNIKARLDTLEALGVRAFQIVHEIDNNVGGPAYFHVMFDLFNLIDSLIANASSAIQLKFSEMGPVTTIQKDSNKHNLRGLTPVGERLVRELMARKLIVDITHLSERGVNRVYEIAKNEFNYYPLFVSHGHFRDLFAEYKQDEKKFPTATIKKIKQTGGVFGLRPPPDRVKTYSYSGVANNCHGSSRSFAQSYMLGVTGYGIKLGFGVDMTGMIASSRPRFYDSNSKWGGNIGINAPSTWACGDSDTNSERDAGRAAQGSRSANGLNNDYDLIGLAHVGHLKNLLRDLNKMGVDTTVMEEGAESFVAMWERINDANRGPLSDSVSTAGIQHSSYTKACPYIAPTLTRRDKVGTKYSGVTGSGTPHYVSVCKAWPHTNIENRNCADYGVKHGAWCIKSRDDGKWYSARQLIEDKCPVPHSKISGLYKSGKIVCQDTLDQNIQDRNCSGSGKYKWGSRCVVAESSYHVRVRNIIEDKCPVPHVKINGVYRYGDILCRDGWDANIQRRNCSGGGKYVFTAGGKDYCEMHNGGYYRRVKNVINDNCPTGYWLQFRYGGNKPVCKPTVTSKIKASKCRSDGGFTYNGWCLWNNGWWYKGRLLK